jgi:hypothetical protein
VRCRALKSETAQSLATSVEQAVTCGVGPRDILSRRPLRPFWRKGKNGEYLPQLAGSYVSPWELNDSAPRSVDAPSSSSRAGKPSRQP